MSSKSIPEATTVPFAGGDSQPLFYNPYPRLTVYQNPEVISKSLSTFSAKRTFGVERILTFIQFLDRGGMPSALMERLKDVQTKHLRTPPPPPPKIDKRAAVREMPEEVRQPHPKCRYFMFD